jgi:pantoate--beta-alanine ligase
MYPNMQLSWVDIEKITEPMCGASRPVHFRGVATVVAKLFNIIRPHRSYFGQKDYQQSLVIQKMVLDLNFDTSIVTCPIVREKDGLALSSRNKYLEPEERRQATVLYKALERARWLIVQGERRASAVKIEMKNMIKDVPPARIDYVEIRNAFNLEDMDVLRGKAVIALAVYIGKTRLIDNMLIDIDKI